MNDEGKWITLNTYASVDTGNYMLVCSEKSMKHFRNNLSSISTLAMASIIIILAYTPIANASETDTDNDYVVITVKESPAFINKAGKVVKQSESLEKVCLSMKLAILLRTELGSGPKAPESPPHVTYFPMLDGVRVAHTDVVNNQGLTCNVEQTEVPLGELLFMLHDQYSVDVQVCWDCWISRYGFPVAVDDPSNPVLGGYEGGDLMEFLDQERMAIQEMFNNGDKVIDFD